MANGRVIRTPQGPRSHDRSADAHIAAIAAAQHGRVARRQLLAAGLSPRQIAGRVRSGHLINEFPGVYAVGHRSRGWEGRWMAAVLACGVGAALCLVSAGAHLEIVRQRPPAIDVACPRALRRRGTIRPHRLSLPADELTVHDLIPTTSVARTLLDLAGVLDRHALERAVNEAEVQRLTSPTSLPTLLERHPRRPGAAALREILAGATLGVDVTLSELEDRLIALLADAGLPRPRMNAPVELPSGLIVVDCLWMPQRVVLELDGERFHGTSHRRRDDLARDRELAASGYLPLRAGWHDVVIAPDPLIGHLSSILEPAPRQ